MQPSRRAFLLGRRPVQTPWARFIQRLTLLCQGPCATWARPARTARAAGWRPRARATWPTPGRCAPSTAWPWRWTARREPPLVPACGWIPRTSAAWPAWPETRCAGGPSPACRWRCWRKPAWQFDGLPGAMTLAEWLAAPAAWPAGRCAQSGPGGRRGAGRRGGETWGLWRERRTAAALGHAAAAGAGAVPAEHGAGRRRLRRGRRLAGRYRLDALRPQAPATVNLAHLLLGHGGTLAWVQEVLLTAVPAAGEAAGGDAPPLDDAAREAGRRLDARIKALFDPDGRFPYSLSRNSGGPRAAGKMGWPRRRGLADGRGPRPQPYRAGRRRNRISPSCTSTCFSPIPWMPIFAKPPSNITSSGAPAKSPSPHRS